MTILCKPQRVLGLLDATLLVMSAVIGSGIFLTSGLIADRLPYPGLLFSVWLAGGIVTFLGALCYAELGAMFPQAGGPYVYLREAFGRASAFIFGWTFFWIIGGGGIAAMAAGFSEYLGAIVPSFSSSNLVLQIPLFHTSWDITAAKIVGIFTVIALTIFNRLGIRRSARGQSILTIVRLSALGLLVGAGLIFGLKTKAVHLHPFWPASGAWPSWSVWGAALITVLWAYDGWYAVNCAAEEVRDPGRNIPKALGFGTLIVLFLYLVTNIVYSMALPMERMRGIVRIGEAAASSFWGPSIAPVFGAVVALTIFGCLNANIFYCSRVPYAMARDGLFFKSLGALHPRKMIPSRALAVQSAVSCFLILTGTFPHLVEFILFGLVFFFAATGAALIVLRKKAPSAERPYRLRPYPLLPGLFILINLGILTALTIEQPRQALLSLGLILSGLPAYGIWREHAKKPASASGLRGEN